MADKYGKIFILLGISILVGIALVKAKPTPPEEKLIINGVGVEA